MLNQSKKQQEMYDQSETEISQQTLLLKDELIEKNRAISELNHQIIEINKISNEHC